MKLNKKVGLLIILALLICLAIPTTSKAALQANGGTPENKAVGSWILDVRKMEIAGGSLGLSDTINETNLTSTATDKNNLDIHMEKNTEFGAMAILSASQYGNSSVIQDGTTANQFSIENGVVKNTTTGNKTGVVININKEWVAAGLIDQVSQFNNANSKYKNSYNNEPQKAGEALDETSGWHGSTQSDGSGLNAQRHGLLRAHSGSIFSFYSNPSPAHWESSDAYYPYGHPTRAVVVIGNGF